MAGIYIHIPFCKKACHYCNFHFSTSHQLLPGMCTAIRQEALLQQAYLSEKIETIYLGGGTPSLITKEEVRSTIEGLRALFRVAEDAEISLEANPDDITRESLAGWKEAGINRLSIGIQSFFEEDLRWMNRAHNAEQARSCIKLAREQGFHNLSIDLIYGTPALTDEKWKRNVDTALSLQIPHLSCYALTVEPSTALARMIETLKSENVDADKQARQFALLMEWTSAAGFEHYEISNFALPGFRSRHNSNYWQGRPYLGLGPSAHSFNGSTRQWNIANNPLYIKSIQSGIVPFEIEVLTESQQLNEYIMTSLRTIEGTSLQKIGINWGTEKATHVLQTARKHIEREHLVLENDVLYLSPAGKFLADGIASDLFSM
ncbi:MAG: hemW [Sediminibacterium sp.]|nr:hemW [Sediminibacterium sp.]